MDLEGDGFDFFGGEDNVTTGEGGWSDRLAEDPPTVEVATDGEAIVFEGKEREDLGRGEDGWLDNISVEVV